MNLFNMKAKIVPYDNFFNNDESLSCARIEGNKIILTYMPHMLFIKPDGSVVTIPYEGLINPNGTFNKEEALLWGARFAGVCYNEEGLEDVLKEPIKNTMSRVNRTIKDEHFSVHGHAHITFNIENIPKILAMILNNEHEYTTSEKSARYTKVKIIENEDTFITEKEETLYNKWLDVFNRLITEQYGGVFKEFGIRTLSQENARYLVSVFMPTKMEYTTSLRQINILVALMRRYMKEANYDDYFERTLSQSMGELIERLDELNVLDERLQTNPKNRSLSLFGTDLDKREEHFGDTIYVTTYDGSLAQYAQAQRHRTLDYHLEFQKEKKFYVPPIIANNPSLVNEWLTDMQKVKDLTPQGEMVTIQESGNYNNFILKLKERLCSHPQLEIMQQTRETLLKYQKALQTSSHPYANKVAKELEQYTHGARCTFPDYKCPKNCGFIEGPTLTRRI